MNWYKNKPIIPTDLKHVKFCNMENTTFANFNKQTKLDVAKLKFREYFLHKNAHGIGFNRNTSTQVNF